MRQILVLLTALVALPALAWDGIASGTITTIDITDANGFGFRVRVNGTSNMCGLGTDWAYLNEADSNYKVYVAALLSAKTAGMPVTVFTNVASSYCKIGYIQIQ